MAPEVANAAVSAAPSGAAEPYGEALRLHSIGKRFHDQVALDDVDLELREREIHALLGENGSGKSTLIKILAGFHEPDGAGTAAVYGESLRLGSAAAAHEAGIRFVHQDLALVPDLDVAENLALGQAYEGRRWVSDGNERRAAQRLLDELEIEVDAGTPVRELGPAQRTLVAVARALRGGVETARILVLDEVTAALPEDEVQMVFALVRRVRDQGGTVLYVTHRLGEVLELADRVTVLRDGERVTTTDAAGLNHDRLVELIVGRVPGEFYPHPPQPQSEQAFCLEGVSGEVVKEATVAVHRGEIVGVAGLLGSGREELLYLAFGAQPWRGGRVSIGDRSYARINPNQAIAAGVALIPADRAARGSSPPLSLRENVTLPQIRAGRMGWVNERRERDEVDHWLRLLQVDPARPEAQLATLSGGNQQKVVLARWLRCHPSVLLLDEPTQGIDVGAKAAIYQQLADRAAEGLAILMASTDLEELAALCDRVLVLQAGRICAELAGQSLTAEVIGELALAEHGNQNLNTRS